MNIFTKAAKRIMEEARRDGRLLEGRSLSEIKDIATRQEGVIRTSYGSLASDSEPMNRSAPHTKNSVDDAFGEEEEILAEQAVSCLREERIVSLDVFVGDGRDGVSCRFLVPEPFAQIAYGLKLLFDDSPAPRQVEDPTYTILFFSDEAFRLNRCRKLLDKDLTVRLMMGSRRGEQVKICRNTMYLGEGKKGVFHFENWRVKAIDRTGVFLHAGARRDMLWVFCPETDRPDMTEVVTAVSGLTATGKTTTLCRSFARLPRESSEMIGDDGGTFGYDGGYEAFEMGGLYVKTEGLDESQPEILRAAESRDAFLENVAITKYPYTPDFRDTSKTGNGRAIVTRANLEIASPGLRADRIHNIIILTRNPLANALSRLTPEQAVMQFLYGESIESSGGNPEEAGKFKREIFLDPFLTGNRLEHAMLFYEILMKNPVRCYLANTGTIGAFERKVTLRQSLASYNDLVRRQIRFSSDADVLGYSYPIQCDRANLDMMVASRLYEDPAVLRKKVQDFFRGRQAFLEEFEGTYGRIPENIRESLPYALED
ncbi:MAG: phosphoenolpyruvate carboxykinase [Syntrophales bacterium]